jgi:hypothetical protein
VATTSGAQPDAAEQTANVDECRKKLAIPILCARANMIQCIVFLCKSRNFKCKFHMCYIHTSCKTIVCEWMIYVVTSTIANCRRNYAYIQ